MLLHIAVKDTYPPVFTAALFISRCGCQLEHLFIHDVFHELVKIQHQSRCGNKPNVHWEMNE